MCSPRIHAPLVAPAAANRSAVVLQGALGLGSALAA